MLPQDILERLALRVEVLIHIYRPDDLTMLVIAYLDLYDRTPWPLDVQTAFTKSLRLAAFLSPKCSSVPTGSARSSRRTSTGA